MTGPAVGEKALAEEGLGDPNCSTKALGWETGLGMEADWPARGSV